MKKLIIYTSQTGFTKRYATDDEKEMVNRISASYDISDISYIEPIVAYLQSEK